MAITANASSSAPRDVPQPKLARSVPIDRIHRPSREEFVRYYLRRHRPVILTGMLEGHPAEGWTPDSLAKRFGERSLSVVEWVGGDNVPEQYIERKQHREMRLADYVARLPSLDGSRELYAEQVPIFDIFPELRSELPNLEPYYDLPSMPASWRRRFVWAENLWLGPRGTVTVLHADAVENFLCQVHGRKRVTLFAREEADNLYADGYLTHQPYHYSPIDVEAPDHDRFPRFRHALAYDDVLSAGEILYLPFAWWHWIRSYEISISVNFFWMRPQSYLKSIPLTYDVSRRLLLAKLGFVDPRLL